MLFITILPSEVRIVFSTSIVTIFHPMPCLIKSACSAIYTNKIFSINKAAKLCIFISSHLVFVNLIPGKVKPYRTLCFWSNSILPVIARHKISTRPSEYRYFQFPDKLDEIFPETVLISKGRGRIINCTIYHSTNRFNKSTVDVRINYTYFTVKINLNHSRFLRQKIPG